MAVPIKPEHQVAYNDIRALLDKHAGSLDAIELLAVASLMVGRIVALQDQRHVSPDRAMRLVAENIALGNLQMIEEIKNKTAGNA